MPEEFEQVNRANDDAESEQGSVASVQDANIQPSQTYPTPDSAEQANPKATGSAAEEAETEASIPNDASSQAKKHGATASNYRDIIAERLARAAQQRGESAPQPRPMAHASDVTASPRVTAEEPKELPNEIPAAIEASTRAQEEPDVQADESIAPAQQSGDDRALSARDRARQRQRERAELRRGGNQRRSTPSVEQPVHTGVENPSLFPATDLSAVTSGEPSESAEEIVARASAGAMPEASAVGSRIDPIQQRLNALKGRQPSGEGEAETEGRREGRRDEGRPDRRRDRDDRRERRDGRPREPRAEQANEVVEAPATEEVVRPERAVRPERQPREERPERQPRTDRTAREERSPREERPSREERALREERPERSSRPERTERTPREERAEPTLRQERTPRPEREARTDVRGLGDRPAREPRAERGARPERGQRPEITQRSERLKEDRSITPAESRGSVAKQSERSFETAKALASKLGVSVVIPLYNEQDSLRELTALLKSQLIRLAGPKFEILYVNDGSKDRSGEILKDILATSSRVTVLSFRRNMGKSAALAAGFSEAQYGIVITMDADLQDDPAEITNLIAKLGEGYDLVSGWKKKRHDPISKTGPSKFFNSVTSFFSGIKLHDFNCGLKGYRKEVTDSLQVYGEMHRYLPALAHWQGYRVAEIPVVHHPRKFGKSKFGSSRFVKGFLDLLSIVFINRYGKRPLHLFGGVGTILAIAGIIIDVWLAAEKIFGGVSLSDRPLLQLGALLILVGVQLVSLGLLGEMIVKNSNTMANLRYTTEKGHRSGELREKRLSRQSRMRGGRPERTGEGAERRPKREARA